MNKRTESLKFCKFNGLLAKATKYPATKWSEASSDVTIWCAKTEYGNVFASWDELYVWLKAAVEANRDQGTPYPWGSAR